MGDVGRGSDQDPRGGAIDLPGKDGKRSLVVAAIKGCDELAFADFVAAYEDIVRRARDGKLTAEDFAGVTISLSMKWSGDVPPSKAGSNCRSARSFQRSGSGLRYAKRGAAAVKNAGMSAGSVVAATSPTRRCP